MILVLIFGVTILLLGAVFHWANLNTPFQTFLPAMLYPVGTGAIIFALGGLLT